MSKVVVDISMSLDGYVAAPEVGAEQGLGVDGEAIHDWCVGPGRTPADEAILAEAFGRTGAVVMGRTTFDIVDGPDGWNDEMGYGADVDPTRQPPVVVVTHAVPEVVRLVEQFTFATGGVEDAVARARELCPDGKDVVVMGGASVIDQCLAAGLVDEVTVHVSSVLLGAGTRLFAAAGAARLEQIGVVETPAATHVTYRIVPG